MAYPYNNPYGYQAQYTPVQPAQQNQNIIWVQGEAGMKAYWVAPGNTMALWDSENPVIYLKTCDMSGIPTVRIIDISYREQPQNAATGDYKALEARIAKIETMMAKGSGENA